MAKGAIVRATNLEALHLAVPRQEFFENDHGSRPAHRAAGHQAEMTEKRYHDAQVPLLVSTNWIWTICVSPPTRLATAIRLAGARTGRRGSRLGRPLGHEIMTSQAAQSSVTSNKGWVRARLPLLR